jgi:hypothetical protein
MPKEQISLTNLCYLQKHQHKVTGAKDVALFHQHFLGNFTEYFRLQLLHRAPYFGASLQNDVAIKSIKNYMRKSCFALSAR